MNPLSQCVMADEHIAALPMYDFPELKDAHADLWRALRNQLLEAGLAEAPRKLARSMGHQNVWQHPLLMLGQACEYPLATTFANTVSLIATPIYAAPGCKGSTYRSAIVVRGRDPARALSDLRGRRCVINEWDSNSGMNLLRASIAPLANGGRFFGSVLLSGSHRRSVAMVAEGLADVAAVDCVSMAHFKRLYPSSVAALRILDWTSASPSLPFISARTSSESTRQKLRGALAAVFDDPKLDLIRERLLLDGIDLVPDEGLTEVLRLKRNATDLGYPVLW
jgi:ABC-type phosphate/phosphonate transport system substrate-binding protein